MEELVRVAHGRYGCKSAYETYKRFARTNTRPGVRPRRWGGREEERTGGREARGRRREELGPQWIQMRINIYKRVRRCGVPFSIPPESGCERCEEILVLAPPCEMRNIRRKNEEESSEYIEGNKREGGSKVREWNIYDKVASTRFDRSVI